MESKSWLALKAIRVKYGDIEDYENFEEYYERIKIKTEFSHIPEIVFEQWLWAHIDKEESITNYGWLNYEEIEFELCSWTTNQLTNINVIESYRDYYKNRASYNDLNTFCCTDKDLKVWKKRGTWRTPPIILDVQSISEEIPNWCEIVPPYQLVEGHSRLGYLKSMVTIDKLGKGKVAEKHNIYVMRLRSTNDNSSHNGFEQLAK
nr:hypothetical protein [uncultured Flavobacterium sp.]